MSLFARLPMHRDRTLLRLRGNRLAVIVFLGLISVITDPAPGRAETLVLAHQYRPGSTVDQLAREFAREVESRSGGDLRIDVASGVFGREPEIFEMAQYGRVDLAILTYVLAQRIPEFEIFNLPYLVRSPDQIDKLGGRFVSRMLDPIAERHALKIVGIVAADFYYIATVNQPVRSPDDLRGMKLRVSAGPWVQTMFESWGTTPVRLAWSETATAARVGVVDGFEVSTAQLDGLDDLDIPIYLARTRHRFAPAYLMTGIKRWFSLRGDHQDLLREVATNTLAKSIERLVRIEKRIDGMGVRSVDVDTDYFSEAGAVVYDRFAREVPDGARLLSGAFGAVGGQ